MIVELFLAVPHFHHLHRMKGWSNDFMAFSQNAAEEPGRVGRGRPADRSLLKPGAAASAAASTRVLARKRSSQCLL